MQLKRGFEVEWCSNVPWNAELQEHEMDLATYNIRDFKTKEAADKFAATRKDWFGEAKVTEFELVEAEPRYWTKEYIGESDFIEPAA